MIKWTDIEDEVGDYKNGFVSTFKKYEGMDTDARDGANRVVKVTISSFANQFGIPETTFRRWVQQEMGTRRESTSRNSNIEDKVKAASDRARTEAEAAAKKALADALANAELEKRKALLAQKQEQEKAAKLEAEKIRKEEQTKAAAAAAKEIAELKAKMAATAKAAEFDISTMTEAQKAQVMTLLANDPEKAAEWFKAQTAERARKLAEQEKAAREAQAKKRQQMEEREARKAAEQARKDYEGSALRKLVDLVKLAKECQEVLRSKGVDFDHILVSGRTAQEWINITEAVEDIAVEYREAIFDVNAKNELADLTE